MVVPGGSGSSGAAARVAGGLLIGGAVLAVGATFLPTYTSTASNPGLSESSSTFSGWVYTSAYGDRVSTVPSPTNGILVVLVAAVAIAAAVTLLVTATRPASRGRLFGALGAGMLIAGSVDKVVPPVVGMITQAGKIQYHLGAGWILLLLAAVCAIAAGAIAISTGPRAAAPIGPWAPGAQVQNPWGAQPPPFPQPFPARPGAGPFPVPPSGSGQFPAQPPRTGGFPAQPVGTGGFPAQPPRTGGFPAQPPGPPRA